MSRYAAHWDRRLKRGTAFFLLSIGAIAAGMIVGRSRLPGDAGWAGFALGATPALLLVIVVACWAVGPRAYVVARGAVTVERPLLRVEIPLRDVRRVGLLPDDALRDAVRLAGVAGAFGYCGRYASPRLGRFRIYATRTSPLVCLQTAGATFVLSPERPERFVEDVLARAPASGTLEPPAASARSPRLWLVGVGVVAITGLAVGAVVLGSWAYAPRAARIADGAVVVERRWTGPERIPLASIRAARVLGRADFRGWRRTSGVALGSVAYGRFRSDALGEFQLYAWRRGPCVLLETHGGKVVLTPEEPARFLADVQPGAR